MNGSDMMGCFSLFFRAHSKNKPSLTKRFSAKILSRFSAFPPLNSYLSGHRPVLLNNAIKSNERSE